MNWTRMHNGCYFHMLDSHAADGSRIFFSSPLSPGTNSGCRTSNLEDGKLSYIESIFSPSLLPTLTGVNSPGFRRIFSLLSLETFWMLWHQVTEGWNPSFRGTKGWQLLPPHLDWTWHNCYLGESKSRIQLTTSSLSPRLECCFAIDLFSVKWQWIQEPPKQLLCAWFRATKIKQD